MARLNLPEYYIVPPESSDTFKTPPVSSTNSVQRTIEKSVTTLSANLRKFGPVYGITKVAGKIGIIETIGGYLYIRVVFCIGEVDQIISIQINNKNYLTGDPTGDPNYVGDWSLSATWTGAYALPYSATAGEIWYYAGAYYELQEDLTITAYTGYYTPTSYYSSYFTPLIVNAEVNTYIGTTTQTVDPILSSVLTTTNGYSQDYDETLTGTFDGDDYGLCYAVIKLSLYSYTEGFPRITAIIKGMKVYDPRTSLTEHSSNPALALLDFCSSSLYGPGWTVNTDSVIASANYCDEAFSDGPRIEINYDTQQENPVNTLTVVDALRTYAHTWLDHRDEQVYFICDCPTSSENDIVFDDDTYQSPVFASFPSVELIDQSQRPHTVTIVFTDTGWKSNKVYCGVSDLPCAPNAVSTEISMPGITSGYQAQRYALYRRKVWQYEIARIIFEVFDIGINMEPGRVYNLTCPLIGLSNVLVRVLSRDTVSMGTYRLTTQIYNPIVYDQTL